MPIHAERGYLIPAIDTDTVDYIACAAQLARSIREWHPDADIAVITTRRCSDPVFNRVVPLPHGDLGGYMNDWQCFDASPYRQTIKLEADMILASPIDHLWTMFEHRDVVISQGCRDIYDQPARSRYYRQTFDINHLPDLYNAITYWRLSEQAQEFFRLVQSIFTQWDQYKKCLIMPDNEPSTDVVYAMAATMIGVERVTLPAGIGPNIVHMKQHIIASQTDDWTRELVWESTRPGLRINTVAQWGLVHYHQKEWRIDEQ